LIAGVVASEVLNLGVRQSRLAGWQVLAWAPRASLSPGPSLRL